MYVCMYIYIYTYIHTYIHICITVAVTMRLKAESFTPAYTTAHTVASRTNKLSERKQATMQDTETQFGHVNPYPWKHVPLYLENREIMSTL